MSNASLKKIESDECKIWPDEVSEICYPCKADNTDQPAFYYSSGNQGRPLLVGLHTWSCHYTQVSSPYAQWCIDNDWVFIYPEFRGPNLTPQGCGSELAIEDIVSAVEYACKKEGCDRSRIYLSGVSGGGHMALMIAGRHPEIWAGITAWCGISNVAKWYYETKKAQLVYSQHIEKVCGGEPLDGSARKADCLKRSPVTYLHDASDVKLDINAGIHDGHTGSVPISQSIDAFNILADPEDMITQTQKDFFVQNQRVPEELSCKIDDSLYGEKIVLFRRESKNVRLTIFEGKHEIIYPAALNFLSNQTKSIR